MTRPTRVTRYSRTITSSPTSTSFNIVMSLPVTSFPVVVGVSPGSRRDSVTSSSAWSRDKDGSVGDVAELKKRVVFRYRSSAGPGTLVMTSQPGTINGRYERNVSTTLKSTSTQNYFTDSEMRKADSKIIFIIIFDPGTQFPGNEKNYSMQYRKSTKKQAGMNLTLPPSQNCHAA